MMKSSNEEPKKKRKKTNLRIVGEEYVGDITMEEAFRKAFEPYFKVVSVEKEK